MRREILEGAEIIKIFSDSGHALLYGSSFTSMTDGELHAVVETAHHRQKKVRSHTTAKSNILKCIEAGVDVLDHVDAMDPECVDAMLAADTHICPSLYLPRAIIDALVADGRGDEPLVQAMQHDFDHMCEMLPIASKAGVKLMVGDDWGTTMTPHGDYIEEMKLYVDTVGIAPIEVLRWATKHGAEAMGLGHELGTVAEGKLADLLVVRGDPSQSIEILGDTDNLLAILKDGAFVKRTF